jgi:hypothetical protein
LNVLWSCRICPLEIEIEIENLENLIKKLTHSCKGEFSQIEIENWKFRKSN